MIKPPLHIENKIQKLFKMFYDSPFQPLEKRQGHINQLRKLLSPIFERLVSNDFHSTFLKNNLYLLWNGRVIVDPVTGLLYKMLHTCKEVNRHELC